MIYKIANTAEEYEQIFKLNYETFVEEIPQHEKNETKKLKDKFHDKNIYIIAKKKNDVIGMRKTLANIIGTFKGRVE